MRSMSFQTGRATHPILGVLAAVGVVILCYLARLGRHPYGVLGLELRKLSGSAARPRAAESHCRWGGSRGAGVKAMSHILAVLILVRRFAPQLGMEGLAVERRQ